MSVLQFDSRTRQSSRRQEQAAAAAAQTSTTLAKLERQQRAECARLAKALGISAKDAREEKYYYHGGAMVMIARAFQKGRKAGYDAIFDVLSDYHHDGYQMGADDARMIGARGVRP